MKPATVNVDLFSCARYKATNRFVFNGCEHIAVPHSVITSVTEGEIDIEASDGKKLHVNAGDIIFIPAGEKYVSRFKGNPNITYEVIHFTINRISKINELTQYKFQKLSLPDPRFAFTIINDMVYAAEANNDLAVLSKFIALFDEIKDYIDCVPNPRIDLGIIPAIRHLKTNYNQKISNSELARLCHLSQSRFRMLFKEATNMTPLQYKNDLAIKNAMTVLCCHERISIEEISEQCGFSSVTFFRRLFRRKTGLSPKEYQKKYWASNR